MSHRKYVVPVLHGFCSYCSVLIFQFGWLVFQNIFKMGWEAEACTEFLHNLEHHSIVTDEWLNDILCGYRIVFVPFILVVSKHLSTFYGFSGTKSIASTVLFGACDLIQKFYQDVPKYVFSLSISISPNLISSFNLQISSFLPFI